MTGLRNPAALAALAKGDIDNAVRAATPGDIEAQEAAGQQELVRSTNMPKDMSEGREVYEKLGFKFGEDADDIFICAELPKGWKRQATDHSMHSDILDEQGRKRIGVFYKAAFYDRSANCYLIPRYRVHCEYDDAGRRKYSVIDQGDDDKILQSFGTAEPKQWDDADRLQKDASAWLLKTYPNCNDQTAYW